MKSNFTSQTPKSDRIEYSFNINLSPRNPLRTNNDSRSDFSIFSGRSNLNPQAHMIQQPYGFNTNNIISPTRNNNPYQNFSTEYSQNYNMDLSGLSRKSFQTAANSILSNNTFSNPSFLSKNSNSIIFGKEDRMDRMEKEQENDKIVQELGKDRRVGVKDFKKVKKYDDDEAIDTKEFQKMYDKCNLESLIDIKLMLSRNGLKLRFVDRKDHFANDSAFFMASISAHRPKNFPKTPIDLIIAIDASDNMKGDKLKYVKHAVKSVVMMMDENDRLSILIYSLEASRITPLLRMTKENKALTLAEVEKIEAKGGSCIYSGLNCAYNILNDRRTFNVLSEVFFVNGGPETLDSWRSFHKIPIENTRNVTVHNFGCGIDYDFKMDRKHFDGSVFHYVEDLKTIDQAFLNCLGEIVGKLAKECMIDLIPQPLKYNSMFTYPIHFSHDLLKSFSDDQYGRTETRDFKTLTFEKSYEFGLEMTICGINLDFTPTPDRKFPLIKSEFKFTDLNGKRHKVEKVFITQLFHPKDDVPDSLDDPKAACYHWKGKWANYLKDLVFLNPYKLTDKHQEDTIKEISKLQAEYSLLPYKDHPLFQSILKEMSIVKQNIKSKRLKTDKHPIINSITHSHEDYSFSFHTLFDYSSKIQKFYQSQAKSFVRV